MDRSQEESQVSCCDGPQTELIRKNMAERKSGMGLGEHERGTYRVRVMMSVCTNSSFIVDYRQGGCPPIAQFSFKLGSSRGPGRGRMAVGEVLYHIPILYNSTVTILYTG